MFQKSKKLCFIIIRRIISEINLSQKFESRYNITFKNTSENSLHHIVSRILEGFSIIVC